VATWGSLASHPGQPPRVLLCIAHDPGVRLRDIAAGVVITERSAYGLLSHAKEPAGWHVVNKPGCYEQPAGGSRASPSDPLDTTATTAAPAPILQ
jgi:hypothetical protein